MTGRAILARFDMQGVVELHVIRQKVDFLPSDGLAGIVSLRELLNVGAVCFYDHMAVHANVQTGNRSVTRNLCAGVTVFAIDLILTCVLLMRKRQRLVGHVALIVSDDDLIMDKCPDKNAET